MKPISFTEVLELGASCEDVFSYMVDPKTAGTIDPTIIEWRSGDYPPKVGTLNHLTAKFLGVPMKMTSRFVESAWEQFTPFLVYPPDIRRVLYTTNMIESLNYQLRKIMRHRGHFPNDDALLKLLYLGVRDVIGKSRRGRSRDPEAGKITKGWKEALNQFEVFFPGRLVR